MPSNSTGFWVAMTMNGRGSGMRLAVDGDLPLAHGFQQSALRPRRGPIDFVGQHDIGEDRPGVEGELPRFRAIDAAAGNVAGQQVGRELDAAELAGQTAGDGLADERLADARHVLQQDMFAGQQGHDGKPDDFALPQDDAADVLAQLGDKRFGWIHGASVPRMQSILIAGGAFCASGVLGTLVQLFLDGVDSLLNPGKLGAESVKIL